MPSARWPRRILLAIAGLVGLIAVLAGSFLYLAFGGLPRPGAGPDMGPRFVRVSEMTVNSFIVRLEGGKLALIDAGGDPEGKLLLEAIAREGRTKEDVVAIFVTHGHLDHVAAIPLFPNATVYGGRSEIPYANGSASFRGPFFRAFMGESPHRFVIERPLGGGETITVSGVQVRAFSLPGHTDGSTAFLIDGALFVGDAANLSSSGEIEPARWIFSHDTEQASRSFQSLQRSFKESGTSFDTIVTSHTGTARASRSNSD